MVETPIVNIKIDAGIDFELPIRLVDSATGATIDTTGATAAMQVRTTADATTALLTATVEVKNGTVTPRIGATLSRNLPRTEAVYDVVITWSTGKVEKLVRGTATIEPTVTR